MRHPRRDEERELQERVAKAIRSVGIVSDPVLYWDGADEGGGLRMIEAPADCGLTAKEIAALMAAGIVPTADGWQVEDAEARPLPAGWQWNQAEDRILVLKTRPHRPGCTSAYHLASATDHEWNVFASEDSARIIASGSVTDRTAAQRMAEAKCWELGLFGEAEKPTPDLGARVAALHEAASVPPSDAARALRRFGAAMFDLLNMPAVTEAQDAHVNRLAEAFVSELRALVAPPVETREEGATPPDQDGALTLYLMRQGLARAWPSDLSATDFAIKIMGEQDTRIGDLERQCEAANEAANRNRDRADAADVKLFDVCESIRNLIAKTVLP